ncbi:MAG: allantoate amidohydrolase [Alphaproteobacteria bacterium]
MLNAGPNAVAEVIMQRLETLAALSLPGPGVTRLPFTDEHRQANDRLAGWMEEAGLEVALDAAGTLVGRRPGPEGARTLLVGSHQDSIRHGGRFDGAMGVVLPLTVLAHMQDVELPFAVELLAFADEEGVRFPTALMGPRALAGTFDSEALTLADADGVTLGDALAGFGGDPAGLASLARRSEKILGYLEVHIEQGPVLEAGGLPVGVVSGICGIERWTVELTGKAAHAGTTPMDLRKDALTAAAEIALGVEACARVTEGLVGVVGRLDVSPNVVNAVPGKVVFNIELRAADDGIRKVAAEHVGQRIETVCQERGIEADVQRTYAQKGVVCDESLTRTLGSSIEQAGIEPLALMSGATHDASAMADLCPVSMLFVRCRDGVSHHPDEHVEAEDCAAAADVVARFMTRLAHPL